MKKFFIKFYTCFVIFSVVFFSVVIVLAFNATEGNTTSDTTTQYSEKQQFIKSIPTFGGGHKHWVVAKMGRAADKIYTDRRPTGKEVWKYRDSCTGDYIIFYFDGNDMLIDYKIGSSY